MKLGQDFDILNYSYTWFVLTNKISNFIGKCQTGQGPDGDK